MEKTVEYKGDVAEVKYSKEDKCYYAIFENQKGDSISCLLCKKAPFWSAFDW